MATAWAALLGSPGGPARVARGAAAGAFAAMIPVFGAHLLLAVACAVPLRGTKAAAVAMCLLLGNPATHAVILPLSYTIGSRVLPTPPAPREDWLPAWVSDALPIAEETLAGGVLLGLAAGPLAFLLVRAALRGAGRDGP
nr:DUF2062 domain-containing protein [Falsiroseomonas bella]